MVQETITEPGPTAGQPTPRRALIVSATIGEGHNSVGRALAGVIAQAWPECDVKWLDALDVMGPGVGPVARACYVLEVERTPWMYEFFFAAIWRHRWFLEATRRVIGWWCGHRMAGVIRRLAPDVIISTYPLGSAGLSSLRRRGRLDIPTGAWVSDFCPHPYWLYGNLDMTYVMHPRALPVVASAEPAARSAVAGLPVTGDLRPGGRDAARARLGVPADRFVVLLSTGSLGFGNVDQAASAILAAGPQVLLVAVCGRNERLRARLAALGAAGERMRVLGWVDDMPGWITAADVLVTNGGGVTALEAIACGRPVVMFQPIAGHGRANASLMSSAGLAMVCPTAAALTDGIRRLAGDGAGRGALVAAACKRAAGRGMREDVRDLVAMPARSGATYPVRAEDALFLHAQAENVPQQVGAIVTLTGGGVDFAALCDAVTSRVAAVPELRQRLLPAAGRWGRPRWTVEPHIDVAARVAEVMLGPGGEAPCLDRLAEQFFATPLDVRERPWEMLLARGAGAGGQDAILVKVHHALGDSFALISALGGLFDPGDDERAALAAAPAARPRRALRPALAHAGRVAAGLSGMIRAGRAPRTPLSAAATGPGRRFARLSLPARAVTVTARRLHTNAADLVLALVAGALGELFAARGEPVAGRRVRVMVPRTVRPGGRRPAAGSGPAVADAAGNRAAGVLLDLPVGPMPLADRVAAVHEIHRERLRRGDAEAAAFVLRALNLLPQPLQRRCARAVYTGAWLSLIVSVFPGIRRRCLVLGTEVEEVFPVLALADGTGLAIGAMTWGASLCVGLIADDAVVPDADVLAAAMRQAFEACAPSTPG